jgi:hypothetical protein
MIITGDKWESFAYRHPPTQVDTSTSWLIKGLVFSIYLRRYTNYNIVAYESASNRRHKKRNLKRYMYPLAGPAYKL